MIYFDNNATTPLSPEVLTAFQEALAHFGNPSSTHSFGQTANNLITKARRTIASFLHCDPHEIYFNSGATEGLNFLIKGFTKPGHVITSSIEHPCVHAQFEKHPNATHLSPKEDGVLTVQQVADSIRPDTTLICLMAANNETGVINEWVEIAHLAEKHAIPFIVDGVALLGKAPFTIPKGVTGMAFSGHKIHAPKGVGFTFLRKGSKIAPLIIGGGQERSLRGGTENVPAIWALAKAMELLNIDSSLRDYFELKLRENLPDVLINGLGPRVSNVSNVSFPGADGESLLRNLDLNGIAVSHGSACSSGALEPSRVLLNMRLPPSRVRSSVRFSFSRYNTQQEVDSALTLLTSLLK